MDPTRDKSSANGSHLRTILVADDDPVFRRLVEKRLQSWDYQVVLAEDGDEAWRILRQSQDAPDLIIMDWLMPGIDGLELCRRLRGMRKSFYQYILLISGNDEKHHVIQGLDAGADDYLTKPLNIGELQARLRAGNRILSLQHELIQAREDLRFQATHDSLTGLWSRGAALDLLNCELQRGLRTEAMTGLLMIDLDHFKSINDKHGHLAGDAVLKEVAGRINRAVRAYDFVGRYGGEEFVAILSSCSLADLYSVAQRACDAVRSSPVITDTASFAVTVSIGGAVKKSGSPDLELIASADSALYEAKRTGRNRFVIAPPNLSHPGHRLAVAHE